MDYGHGLWTKSTGIGNKLTQTKEAWDNLEDEDKGDPGQKNQGQDRQEE